MKVLRTCPIGTLETPKNKNWSRTRTYEYEFDTMNHIAPCVVELTRPRIGNTDVDRDKEFSLGMILVFNDETSCRMFVNSMLGGQTLNVDLEYHCIRKYGHTTWRLYVANNHLSEDEENALLLDVERLIRELDAYNP